MTIAELKQRPQWICWRLEAVGGRSSKVPYGADGIPVGTSEAHRPRWRTYGAALQAVDKFKFDGVGVVFTDGLCGIDVDHRGMEDPDARAIVDSMDTYTEKSPGGKGLHILFTCDVARIPSSHGRLDSRYYSKNPNNGVECYFSGLTSRYFTFTGHIVRDMDIADRTDQALAFLEGHMLRGTKPQVAPAVQSYLTDESVIAKAEAAKNGDAFKRLWAGDITGYGSQSEADLALASMLAFYCGRDIAQMDRLFRRSSLYREKWDREQSGTTYGAITLEKASATVSATYTPGGCRPSMDNDFHNAVFALEPASNLRFSWNDIGTGNLFADIHKDVLRFVPERKLWYFYTGSVWKPDTGSLFAMERCKRLFEALMGYALGIADERRRTDYIKFVSKYSIRGHRETILKDAQGVHPVTMGSFDKDPYLFNSLNGTYNLRTGLFREHRASDMLTKLSGVWYDPAARCERWETFIPEVMSDDAGKARYLQKTLGYALSGDTRYEALFILYGPTTRNGKGCTMETMLKLLGGYGLTARPETIGAKTQNNGNAPSEDVARLAGSRCVNVSEPDKKLTLNAALVKSMVGNDTLNARHLYEGSFDFIPQFKLFINCNHLPAVTDLSLFTSDRVKIIPFERHFEESERDAGLKGYFARPENLSGIFNWCAEGFRLMEAEGLDMPQCVRDATTAYQRNSDKTALFIDDCLEAKPDAEERTAAVYDRYRSWCQENGYYPESARNLNQSLSAAFHVVRKRPHRGVAMTTVLVGARLAGDIPPCARGYL